MALTPRSGFSNTTSGQNDIPDEIPNTQSDVLNNMPFITDSNLNKYAIDTAAYPNTTKMLVGFMKGKRVSVTYYRLLRQGGVNNRSNIADYPTARNVLEKEYQKIINLEITLPHGLEFSSDNESAAVGVSGEALFYPGMNPSIGDIFTMGLGDGRIGVFQLSAITPGSWRTDRIYTVKFVLQSFLTSADSDPIEGSVTVVSIFSKENYLGGTVALLSEVTYKNLLKIKEIRTNLIRYYYQIFFDSELCSYIRPDGIYDPHVVKFISNKTTMDDIHTRPKLLTGSLAKIYKGTIWGRLEDRFNNTMYGLTSQFNVEAYTHNRMGVFVTELVGYPIINVDKTLIDQEYYVFTENFYTTNLQAMTPLELRIHTAVINRSSGDLSSLITEYLDPVYSLEPLDKFYKIPLYIHLIDMALQSQYREIDAPSMGYSSTGE